MFVFSVFRKNCFIKSCLSSEDLPEYKISLFYIEWCNFCIHLRSSNVLYFAMVAAIALKIVASMSHSVA
jgi:hypothetical protein